jgi:hypothetical protein
MALAQSIDGTADARDVVRVAALDSGIPLEPEFGERFLAAMTGAGWVHEVTAGTAPERGTS